MDTKIIARVNNVDIVSTSDEQMVAIKPICEILGVDYEAQRQRIYRDEILNSTACIIKAVAADNKEREMVCLPRFYMFGWLFTIDASKVNDIAKESVLKYKLECYKILNDHFTEPETFLKEKQKMMEQRVQKYQDCQRQFKDAQKLMNEAKAELNQVMRVTIDEWRENNKQLTLNFSKAEE
jgi:hypothetical protein